MRFHDAAAAEMVEAAEWYESKAVGVGSRRPGYWLGRVQ